jgi:hypothetical protein
VQRQQHHHRPRRRPPPALQLGAQLLDLAARTFGEHADRAHADHDLAGWIDDGGNLDTTPGEADVNAPHPGSLTGFSSRKLTALARQV